VEQLGELETTNREELMEGFRPAQVAYLAAGLAEWDAHVAQKRSSETDRALQLMFAVQQQDGSWGNAQCWPPLESSPFHATTVAAMAAAAAPAWLATVQDHGLSSGVESMLRYLRETKPPHDYDRLLLLWTSTRIVDLLDEQQCQAIREMAWKHQRPDGGWSIRSFAQPEAWGGGNRAEKLRAEPEFARPPSDGHQTGLVVSVLRDAGVPADDPRLKRAVQWLQTNQRASGRWWTRSLNTDRFHFITYSGTLYPLLALYKCDALPERPK
jgi:squalene-hopene/tetraprenyl-beta-curcumene cyclase